VRRPRPRAPGHVLPSLSVRRAASSRASAMPRWTPPSKTSRISPARTTTTSRALMRSRIVQTKPGAGSAVSPSDPPANRASARRFSARAETASVTAPLACRPSERAGSGAALRSTRRSTSGTASPFGPMGRSITDQPASGSPRRIASAIPSTSSPADAAMSSAPWRSRYRAHTRNAAAISSSRPEIPPSRPERNIARRIRIRSRHPACSMLPASASAAPDHAKAWAMMERPNPPPPPASVSARSVQRANRPDPAPPPPRVPRCRVRRNSRSPDPAATRLPPFVWVIIPKRCHRSSEDLGVTICEHRVSRWRRWAVSSPLRFRRQKGRRWAAQLLGATAMSWPSSAEPSRPPAGPVGPGREPTGRRQPPPPRPPGATPGWWRSAAPSAGGRGQGQARKCA